MPLKQAERQNKSPTKTQHIVIKLKIGKSEATGMRIPRGFFVVVTRW